jgi:hypothetical protein
MENQITKQDQSWIALSQKATTLRESLQNQELALQGLCQTDSRDYKVLEGIIATYDKNLKVMIAERMAFTSIIDNNLIKPAMAFEKRAKEFEGYQALKSKTQQLKLAAEAEAKKGQAIESEKAAFSAHCKNQALNQVAAYKHLLNDTITHFFSAALSAGIKQPVMAKLVDDLKAIKIPSPAKWEGTLLTLEDKFAIHKTIPEPDFSAILVAAVNYAHSYHQNEYQTALLNREAAIEQMQKDAESKRQAQEKEMQAKQAANTLMAAATAESVAVEVPKIKREIRPVIHETQQWVVKVLVNFASRQEDLWKYIRVKSMANLTVEQMAQALAKHHQETGEIIEGLEFTEIIK